MTKNENQGILEIIKNNSFNSMLFGRVIPAKRIIVLAPHCDDEVLGCGGTILEYLKKQCQVVIIYLTLDKEKKRKIEALNAWNSFDNIVQEFFSFEDSMLSSSENDCVNKLCELIQKYNPDIIFTPWFIDMHNDHRATSTFLAHSLKAILTNTAISTQYIACYEVNFPVYINYSINITKSFEQKIEILKNYVSQNPEHLENVIKNLNKYRAEQIGLRQILWAEAYYVCNCEFFCTLIERFL
ncbi:PIG-L family deacetylase [Clostridium sp. BNL1100]|uniref:PIG-L deacetylase family protein n=1 Tax=Clostridium sp. BNL1100 TaxID=755731 RepID=UPI00024A773F|nr:PIG-L family deacetylase [Clostridium sp. BNL1100]AEY67377.1 putative LmbE-like protein [Clostridium sp. BNL1100]